MFKYRTFAALAVVLGLVATASAQDKPVLLKWKFEKGKPFYQTMETKTNQTIKVMGSDIKQTQNQTFYYSWTLTSDPAAKDADLVFKQKIEGVKMDINIGGSKIEFDSTKTENTNNTLAEFFKALVGFEFTVTLDPKTLKVKKIDGKDEFVKKLSSANPTMETLLKQILNEDAMKEMADPTFSAVPNAEAEKGKPSGTWSRKSNLDMGPIGKYETTYTYTYDGAEKDKADLQKIKVETLLKYTPPGAGVAGAGLPFKIQTASIKDAKGTGTVLFNTAKGWVESSEISLTLTGSLDIEIGGQVTKVDLDQTQSTKVTTSDTNPVKK